MTLYDKIIAREEKISVVGLGYVGMPIAVALADKASVIGFDTNRSKVELYKRGQDPTKEVGNEAVAECSVDFTDDEVHLREAKFHIVAVPTPVNSDHTPDLSPIESASAIVGRNLSKNSVVVYESTVYPGVTEEICIPILEKESGLKCGNDFTVGYSPERINPGDKQHRLENITKIVSGMDQETLDVIAGVYGLVVKAGIYKAKSIRVAEAAKVIENSQRDINIAFMNELSIIFDKLGIDTKSVLEAAGTKWNFLDFSPGLVGGHCIGVDPYYLTYKAEKIGYHSQIILAGRRINDDMGRYIAQNLIKCMVRSDIAIKDAKVAVMGFTFKENCPDTRNTKVIDIIHELEEYGIKPYVTDPVADPAEVEKEYGIKITPLDDVNNLDVILLAVAHEQYLNLSRKDIDRFCQKTGNSNKIIIDVKGVLNREEYEDAGYHYWRL